MLRKILSLTLLGSTLALVFIFANVESVESADSPAPATVPTGLQKANTGLTNIGTQVFGGNAPQPIERVVGNIIQTGLTLVGVIFLILTVYGGYIWMAARGEEAEVERAKNIIKNAVIGLAVVAGAYAVTAFVTVRLLAASGLSA